MQLFQRAGIEYILFLQPAAPRLADAVMQIIEILSAVGIAADGDEHAFFFRHLAVDVEQVEALGVRVEFEKTAALTRLADTDGIPDPRICCIAAIYAAIQAKTPPCARTANYARKSACAPID